MIKHDLCWNRLSTTALWIQYITNLEMGVYEELYVYLYLQKGKKEKTPTKKSAETSAAAEPAAEGGEDNSDNNASAGEQEENSGDNESADNDVDIGGAGDAGVMKKSTPDITKPEAKTTDNVRKRKPRKE